MDIPTPNFRRRRIIFSLAVLVSLTALAVVTGQAMPAELRTVTTQVKQITGGAAGNVLDAQPGLWHVAEAIDGDTIEVTLGAQRERVRLLGIDTPETHDPRKPVQCFGQAAANHTKQLLADKNVRLEPDPTNSDRDKYGRLLRYVYLPDGTLVNAALVSGGYAFAYTIFPFERLDEFRALEREAREANRGLWAGCRVDESNQIKQTSGAK
jgi:micrococcal nuclease